jgi:hypothetical protein
MSQDRKTQDDLYVGILVAVLHSRTGNITWGFKEYDPDDKTDFPMPLQFRNAGEIVEPKNPGRVLEVQTGDALVIFVDHEYKRLLRPSFYVDLDYEAGKVPDPEIPNTQVQMIGESRVNGIPNNIDVETWREVFSEGRPAVLFRPRPSATALNAA